MFWIFVFFFFIWNSKFVYAEVLQKYTTLVFLNISVSIPLALSFDDLCRVLNINQSSAVFNFNLKSIVDCLFMPPENNECIRCGEHLFATNAYAHFWNVSPSMKIKMKCYYLFFFSFWLVNVYKYEQIWFFSLSLSRWIQKGCSCMQMKSHICMQNKISYVSKMYEIIV